MPGFMKKGLHFAFLLLIPLIICSCDNAKELELSGQANEQAFELPDFKGQHEGLFEKLVADKMSAIHEVSEEADMKKMPFHAIYTLNNFKGKDSKLLNISIKDNKSNKEILSYDMHLDIKNKSVKYGDLSASRLVENKRLLNNFILLKQWGIPLEMIDGEKAVTKAEWINMLVSAFEAFAGFEINTDEIDEGLAKDFALKKALEIDIIDVKDLESINEPLKRQDAIVYYLSFVEEIEERLYSHACQTASVSEAKELLALICKMQKKEIDDVSAAYKISYSLNKSLTRLELANIIMVAYEQLIPTVPVIKGRDTLFSDTKSTNANKAVSCGVMNYFANNNTFLPHKELRYWEIITPLKNFVKSTSKNGNEDDKVLNFEDSVELLAIGLAPFTSKEKVLSQDIVVLNERPYDWYCNQLNTGKYSKVNCVPSCVEMAIAWRDKDIAVTVEELREQTMANGQGWNGRQMTNALKSYGIEPESRTPASLEAIKENLDKGSLIILMINEGAANEGHAVVIKGYRQNKAGIWFVLNDPFSVGQNKYGLPSGQGREMEGEHLAFLCARFTNTFFVISPNHS